ncbi:hypothetical protein ACIBM4_09960 [Streptomyces sp. NPDC050256]|uniref:hypothetical protein n=1 Tax=Streptomyces sp. NPDC050256 TaxID=3365607 RepID=UPI003797B2A1
MTRALVAGWVVLAVAGWGFTQWVGEPAATPGPARVVPPASGAEPGPQPEFDCAEAVRAAKRSQDRMEPSATGMPTKGAPGRDSVQSHVSSVLCDYAVYESP